MMLSHRSRRDRNRTCRLQPVMAPLEERVLLNAAMPHGCINPTSPRKSAPSITRTRS